MNNESNCIAVIPARGGSKGIPRKNLAVLAGRPLLAWCIEAALGSRRVDGVVVSTDDDEIGRAAERCGAEVVWRPEAISGDTATSESALLHVLAELERTKDTRPDFTVFMQCTSPLTTSADVDGTIDRLERDGADTAIAAVPFHHFLWRRDGLGTGVGLNHDGRVRHRRQDREPEYLEAGSVYALRTAGFVEHGSRFFGRTVLHKVPLEHCWEIDDPVDLQIAEVLLRERERKRLGSLLPDPVEALAFDFDGVFTDNRVQVSDDGHEAVVCDRGDGWGVARLRDAGLPIIVISAERNPVAARRCEKLGIDCRLAVDDKWSVLSEWLASHGLDAARTVFVGNDVNDLTCLQGVGCGVAVADAHPRARAASRIVLEKCGGRGAVRELADLVLAGTEQSRSRSQR